MGTFPGRSAELMTVYASRDPMLHQLAAIFHDELQQPDHPAQRLLLESASCMLTAHLVRRYCTHGAGMQTKPVRIAARALNEITAFVEDNVAISISLDDLAAMAGVSRFHFCRAFRESVGLSPMQFVEKVKIRRAQDLIRSGRLNMRRVAAAVGYADQSHFTRRFALQAKCTPSEFAASIRMRGYLEESEE